MRVCIQKFGIENQLRTIKFYFMNALKYNQKQSLKYPHRIQLYEDPPDQELQIEEFEQFALDRLQLLKALETARVRNKKDVELDLHIRPIEKKYLPLNKNSDSSANLDAERRKDVISHFILRLAYCRSEDLRRWFLLQECALFRYRFESEPSKDKEEFIKQSGLCYQSISSAERKEVLDRLVDASSHIPNAAEKEYYKVPFENAIELIGQRKVFVHHGQAYVASNDLASLVVGEFRNRLSRALVTASKAIPRMEEDQRLVPVLNNMSRQYIGPEYTSRATTRNGQVTADNLEQVVQHFPLCMQHLHAKLTEDSHLKYGGRQQYGLFLKGIGMSLEEALLFWKRVFCRKIGEDKFQREYGYNIRHSYGQEGKRTNYAPYNCVKIITSNQPSSGDHHGCPFKHFSQDNLRSLLHKQGAPEKTIQEIFDLVRNQHYQIACSKYFEVMNKVDEQTEIISHPNDYFDRSLKLVEQRMQQTKLTSETN